MRKPVDEVKALIESGRRKMIEARRARPAPAIDRNILSDWNGMMVSSYLKAYETLGDEEARAFALKTLDFILKRNFSATTGMYHSLLGGERLVPGLLDDQVMIARALLDAYEVTGDPNHLIRARQIMIWTIQNLWDASGGAFFDSQAEPECGGPAGHSAQADSRHACHLRQCGCRAGAQPPLLLHAGNTVSRLRESHDRDIRGPGPRRRHVHGRARHRRPASISSIRRRPIVIGKAGDPMAAPCTARRSSAFRPGKIVMRVEPDRVDRHQLPAAVRPVLDSVGAERWPLAFVCSATACALPTASPTDVAALVRNFGLTRR